MQISLLTMNNSKTADVEGHRAGCADIAKKVAARKCEQPWTADWSSKREAFLDYNSDFIAEEGDESNCWNITWLPCADALPTMTVGEENQAIIGDALSDLTVHVEKPMTKTEAYAWVKRSREGLREVDFTIYKGVREEVREALMETIGAATMLLDALDNQGIKGL